MENLSDRIKRECVSSQITISYTLYTLTNQFRRIEGESIGNHEKS